MCDDIGASLIHSKLQIEHDFIRDLEPGAAIRYEISEHLKRFQLCGAGDLKTL
jgi:hypothetical protein